MTSIEMKEYIKRILDICKIDVKVEEMDYEEHVMHYDAKAKTIFFSPKNIIISALRNKDEVLEHIELVLYHEIGHVVDYKQNGDKYEEESIRHQNTLASLYSPDTIKDIDSARKKVSDLLRESNKLILEKEEAAWEAGYHFVRKELITKYQNLRKRVLELEKQRLERLL